VADNQITGTCKGEEKDHPITGKIDGKTATWQVEPDSHGTQLTFIYTATLDDSAKFAGTFEVKPYGVKGEFTAAVSSPASQAGPVDAAVGQRLVLEAGPGGLFKNQADIGKGDPAGHASFDAKSGCVHDRIFGDESLGQGRCVSHDLEEGIGRCFPDRRCRSIGSVISHVEFAPQGGF